MTRKSKEEIVLLDATSLLCKSLALGHLSYYHIRSCHTYLASLRCHMHSMGTLMLRQLCHLPQRPDASVCCTARWLRQWANGRICAEGLPMKELIEQIARAIVEKPEEVQVRGIEGEHAVVIELRGAKEDIGKVIGKKGRPITAMRTILNATRAQTDKRQVLEVIE